MSERASYRERYKQVRWEQDVEIVVQGVATYPNQYAVSPERADELRAEWKRATDAWFAKTDSAAHERWAETFAPDHPEWFDHAETPEAA